MGLCNSINRNIISYKNIDVKTIKMGDIFLERNPNKTYATIFEKLITFTTNSEYYHTAIVYDDIPQEVLNKCYKGDLSKISDTSISRRFVMEFIMNGDEFGLECRLLTDFIYQNMKNLHYMKLFPQIDIKNKINSDNFIRSVCMMPYEQNTSELMLSVIHLNLSVEKTTSYFCSEFVCELLKHLGVIKANTQSNNLPNDISLMNGNHINVIINSGYLYSTICGGNFTFF
jgi:hypothetical protein